MPRATCVYAHAHSHGRVWQHVPSVLLALAMLVVCGCGGLDCSNLPPPDLQPPTLHLPHVRPVRGLDDTLLHAAKADVQNNTNGVDGLTTYQALGGSYALATLTPDVYALPLPDGPAARVEGLKCADGSVTLTADAARLACLGLPDPSGNKGGIVVAEYTPGVWPPHAMLLGTFPAFGSDFLSPAWRPSGDALAVLERTGDDRCDIALLVPINVADPYTAPLALTARFTVAGEHNCAVLQLAWSLDGRTLAALTPIEALLLEPPRAWLTMPGGQPASVSRHTLAPRRRLPVDGLAHEFAWAPDGHGLTVLREGESGSFDGEWLASLPLNGNRATQLFPIPQNDGSRLGTFAWTPDDSGVLFAYGEREMAPDWHAEGWFASGFVAQPARPLGFGCPIPEPPPRLFFYATATSAA